MINKTMSTEMTSESSPASALAISCCAMAIVGGCVVVGYLLMDRIGFIATAGSCFVLATLPLMLWTFGDYELAAGEKPRWQRSAIVAGWIVQSFFMLLVAQRLLSS